MSSVPGVFFIITVFRLLSCFLYFLCKTFRLDFALIKGLEKWRYLSNWFVLRCLWTTYPRNLSRYERSVRSDRYCNCYYNLLQKSEMRNSDFKYFLVTFFLLSFFRIRPRPKTNYLHNIWNPPVFCTLRVVKLKRAPDLGEFIRYSLLGPLCSASFFKFCLHHPGMLLSNLVLQTFKVSLNWDWVKVTQ